MGPGRDLAETLSYLEAHGTGTELGDPIEVRGITDALRRRTGRRQFIPLGSVKGNIGHLMDGAAGLSGLLKAMLVLEHRIVPPTAGLDVPNPHIDFLDSPVFVPTEPWPLPRDGQPGVPPTPLRAGVSCFGFNGTNAHWCSRKPPPRAGGDDTPADLVFPVSAATAAALRTLLARHGRWTSSERPRDVAYTLTVGREHLAHRVAVLARTNQEFRQRCATLAHIGEQAWTAVVPETDAADNRSAEQTQGRARSSTWSNSLLFLPPPFMKTPSAASAFLVMSAPAASQAGNRRDAGCELFADDEDASALFERDENPIRRAGDERPIADQRQHGVRELRCRRGGDGDLSIIRGG